MSGYLVDTDWIIDAIHERADATRTPADLSSAGIAISTIMYGELYEGAYYARDRSAALAGLRQMLNDFVFLSPTTAIMEIFGIVRGGLTKSMRQQVGDLDLVIAATALAHDLTLLTRNLRDFQQIPNLKLYRSP